MTNLIPTLRLSLEMTNVLAHIEQNGIKINKTTLAEIREEYEQELFQLERRLNELAVNAMGDTPVNLDSPDDRSMLMYSCKVADKKTWAVIFNLGHEMRGATRKPKQRKRMSRAEFKGYVVRETDVVYKTIGSQCSDCNGKGRYNPLRKDGSVGKAVRICKTCNGKGVVYTSTGEVAGFKMVPREHVFTNNVLYFVIEIMVEHKAQHLMFKCIWRELFLLLHYPCPSSLDLKSLS